MRLQIDWTSLIALLCFTLYLRAIFQVQAPGGLIFGGFFSYQFGGLIHGGAYFQSFMVCIKLICFISTTKLIAFLLKINSTIMFKQSHRKRISKK